MRISIIIENLDVKMTRVFKNIQTIRQIVAEYKAKGERVGFVPTMGALHRGHESLLQAAKKECDRVIASIFVNPIQFAPNEDFLKYPRQLPKDLEICEINSVDAVFAPLEEEIYPHSKGSLADSLTKVIPPNNFQDKLCGKSRPGHFNGVATVVLKLFNIIQPDKAYFGQKDAQQLFIIKKMVKDLDIPVEIVACPIVRDEDGLALSSRNAYLSLEDRQKSLSLYKTLKKVENSFKQGILSPTEAIKCSLSALNHDITPEYFQAVDPTTFEDAQILEKGSLILIAARVGDTRLIDNIFL